MPRIFDSHAHYEGEAFDPDRETLLPALFAQKGVVGIVNCGSDFATSKASIALAEQYPGLFAAAGVHPHEAAAAGAWNGEARRALTALLAHPKCVAVGEIGLDYHYDFSPREQQKAWFEGQLALAVELDMPVVVHDREAHEDTLTLLRRYRPKGVVHCFSGSVEMAREVLSLGLYIGLGGAVTFHNAKKPAAVAQMAPLDRLLLETDCPYMAPVPFRGQRCDSSMIAATAEKIAALRQMPVEELLAAAEANARRLFGLPPA